MKHPSTPAIAFFVAACLSLPLAAREDIVSTAARNGSFNTLVSLLVATGLDRPLREGEFTVFAPTDDAFAALPAETLEELRRPENREQLAAILKYHVIESSITVPRDPPSHPLRSAQTLSGQKVQFRREGTDVRVNDARIITRDIRCDNGLIQVIDSVLLPPSETGTIVEVAAAAGSFKTLLAAAKAAGLAEALAGDGPFTLLAPTDEAFAKLGDDTIANLLKEENRDQLTAILMYHVLPGRISAAQAASAGADTQSLLGKGPTFAIEKGCLLVNGAAVTNNDLAADNGLIHVIDSVLIPPTGDSLGREGEEGEDRIVLRANWRESIDRDGLTADVVEISCSAGGTVRLTNVTANRIVTRIGGGGTVELEGTATQLEANVGGGARFEARKLAAEIGRVVVNGGGNATLNVTRALDLKANGGAAVRYVETGAEITRSINRYATFEPLSQDSH